MPQNELTIRSNDGRSVTQTFALEGDLNDLGALELSLAVGASFANACHQVQKTRCPVPTAGTT